MEEHVLKIRMYAGSGLMTIEEVSRITHVPQTIIERLIEEEIVRPAKIGEAPLFTRDAVQVIERSLRLHDDLGVNWPGVAIIENLLERMESLQDTLPRFPNASTQEGEWE